MKTLLLLLCLVCSAVAQPVLRNSATTNATMKFPALTPATTSNARIVGTINNDGTVYSSDAIQFNHSGGTAHVILSGDIIGNGSGLTNLPAGAAQLWTNDNTVIRVANQALDPTNFGAFQVEVNWSTTNLSLYSHLLSYLGSNYIESRVELSPNNSGLSYDKVVIDQSEAGTAQDPWFFFRLMELNTAELCVLDPTVSGFRSDAWGLSGPVTAYKFDTYYAVTNGQNIASWGNGGTNKAWLDYNGVWNGNGSGLTNIPGVWTNDTQAVAGLNSIYPAGDGGGDMSQTTNAFNIHLLSSDTLGLTRQFNLTVSSNATGGMNFVNTNFDTTFQVTFEDGVVLANQYVIQGTTNQIVFGATNTAPVDAATPKKWISVQVQGEATVYRLPLYQ